jgi:NAD(P)-dependent dehydrogenase (short-subunit alcohol dehydrogenase family)
MAVDLHGKVAFVTGAASGMGRLAARRWAEAGGLVAALDVDEEGLRETARGLDGIRARRLDVTQAEAVRVAVKETEADLGPIERVYNAAAIQPTRLLLEQDIEEIERVMAINYGGVVHVSLAALPPMLERGYGALVNFASIAGWVPNMHFGAYCAAKFAVVAFSEVLHHENRGRGVQILCVCPGKVDTPLIAQATSKPKILNTGPAPMPPGRVLDAIDRAIEKRRFWSFPGVTTGIGWRLRRFFPGLMWWIDHRAEGF